MSKITVHNNLIDMNLSINNNLVLNYFMENFDFKDYNTHFVKDV